MKKIFKSSINHDNFIVRDHLVHGIRIAPGVTFLDMVCRLANKHLDGQAIEINNVLFRKPLATSEQFDRKIITQFEPIEETNCWRVHIASQKIKDNQPVNHKLDDHADCTLVMGTSLGSKKTPFNVERFVAQAEQSWDMDEVYSLARAVDILHLEFMKTLGTVYQSDNEELMALYLSDLAESVRSKFVAHPAFLDGSTFGGSTFNLSGKDKSLFYDNAPYIPFMIKRFQIYRQLPQKIYVHTKLKNKIEQDVVPDLIVRDVTIYDQNGNTLVSFEGLIFKRIREPNLIKQLIDLDSESNTVCWSPIPPVDKKDTTVSAPSLSSQLNQANSDNKITNTNGIVVNWIKDNIATLLSVSSHDIDTKTGFYDLGLNSTQLLDLTKQLETICGHEFYPTLLFEYQTVMELADYLWENDVDAFMNYSPQIQSESHIMPSSQHQYSMNSATNWIKGKIGQMLSKSPHEIDSQTGFYDLGLNSNQLLELTKQLEVFYRREFYPTLLFEYQTVSELTSYLHENNGTTFRNISSPVEQQEPPAATTVTSADRQNITGKRGTSESSSQQPEPIAIVGLAGKYPESNDLEAFWQAVRDGKNCISEVPPDRWETTDLYADKLQFSRDNPHSASRWGGFIPDVDKFDPLFFNISPREAEGLDPQLRLLLQTAWGTMEDAGYQRQQLKQSSVGVYVGVMNCDYTWLAAEHLMRTGKYESAGSYAHELANRISYHLDVHGPSLTIEAACTSSFTAIHLARQAILSGECDVAFAGGVNINVHRSKYFMLTQLGIISPDGIERTFDDAANGYVPAEGVGMVMLKKLSQAQADRDHIYGVITGSSINHSGKGSGKYVPNLKALALVSKNALAQSGLEMNAIDYIETHGTGTKLGDPIEIQALAKLFDHNSRKKSCALGSKANIGHMESASGIGSLTKVLLAMRHGEIPACANVSQENTALGLSQTPFFIPKKPINWQKSAAEKVAGISSFGVGGSNGFMVVQSIADTSQQSPIEQALFILSARTQTALDDYIQRYVDYLTRHEKSINLSDLAYTLQVGRENMAWRIAFVAYSVSEIISQLKSHLGGQQVPSICYGKIASKKESNLQNLLEGEAGSLFLRAIFEQKQLNKLAFLWTQGINIDWISFYQSNPRKRLNLPTYPFEKRRCWLGETEADVSEGLEHFDVVVSAESSAITKQKDHFSTQATTQANVIYATQQWLESPLASQNTWDSFEHFTLPLIATSTPRIIISTFKRLFEQIKRILKSKPKNNQILIWTTSSNVPEYCYAPIIGLLKTARLENPKLLGKVVILPPKLTKAEISAIVAQEAKDITDVVVCYLSKTQRQVMRLSVIQPTPSKLTDHIKQGGVYLITGGAGGLGLIFARHINQVSDAKVILIGRTAKSKKELGFDYLSCDISKLSDVKRTLESIISQHGRLDGIIHSAGVIRDNFIINKNQEEIEAVMAPKVKGAWNLHQALQNKKITPDFVVFFSSITAIMGNLGQADYAGANAFLDAFAKTNHYKVINWPLWADGGMQVNQQTKDRLMQTMGMEPLSTFAGEKALQIALHNQVRQLLVVQGQKEILMNKLSISPTLVTSIPISGDIKDTTAKNNDELQAKLTTTLIELAAKILKIKPDDLSDSEDIGDYGFDSILLVELTDKINQKLSLSLMPMVLLQHNNFQQLSKYLLDSYHQNVTRYFCTEYTAAVKTYSLADASPTIEPRLSSAEEDTNGIENNLGTQLTKRLISIACQLLKIKPEDIDFSDDISDYGFDSISLAEFTHQLNTKFELNLAPIVLLEHDNFQSLTQYLLSKHKHSIEKNFNQDGRLPNVLTIN